MRSAMRLLVCLGCLSFASAPLSAQSTDATLLGTVHDPSGNFLPGVTITVTNVRTNATRTVVTSDAGTYEIRALQPSEYTLAAELSGFKKQVLTGLALQVNQAARVDVTLQLGDVVEAVTVEVKAPLVQAATGALGQVIDNRQIVELPLNGRNFTQLATLTPGVTASAPLGTGRASSVAVSGSRATKTEFLLDGVSATGPINGGTGVLPSVDALQEFKVQTSAFAAEFGRAPGIVNISIKSGTNDFRGGVYGFLRNDVFDARHTFALEKPPLERHQYGGLLGGPIRANSLFFFVNYEGLREKRGLTYNLVVPTAAQRRGEFGATPIFDPATTTVQGSSFTRTPFAGNRIPADRIAPQAAYFLKFIPEANTADGRFVHSPSTEDENDQLTLRIDKTLGGGGNLFGRYTLVDVETFTPAALPALVGQTLTSRFQNAGISYTRALRPSLLSETRFGYNREYTIEGAPGIGTNHTVAAGILGFERTTEEFPRFPQIGITGFTGIDGRTFRPLNNTNDIFQVIQSIAWFTGSHTWKAGVDYRYQNNSNFNAASNSGSFSFTGAYTRDPSIASSGSAFADFLLGVPGSAGRSFPREKFGNRFTNLHVFVQDDWRATDDLTINLGLRYEYNPWPLGYDDQLSLFDLERGQVILSSPVNLDGQKIARAAYDALPGAYVTTEELGLPRQIQSNDMNNFAPRVGFAWRMFGDDRTVLRGGYGLFYELVNGNGRTGGVINPPFLFDEAASNNTPVPNRTLENFFFTQPPSAASPPIIDSRPLDQQLPYEETWNVTLQREFMGNTAVEVSYLGKRGRNLERDVLFNQPVPGPGALQARRPYPRFGQGILRDDGGRSSYHALQAKVERRLSAGLSFLASYAYGKSMDDVSSDIGGSVQDPRNFDAEWAVSDFDITHNLVVSGLYELPFGEGKPWLATGPTSRVLGGWQVGAIVQVRSGLPFTPRISVDQANTGTPQRPNRIGSGELDDPTIALWFNPADFTLPAAFTYGDSGRNILRGDNYVNVDFVLSKTQRLFGRTALQMRAEAFNLFNHANYGLPNAVVNTATAGRVLSAADPRILQFGLKLTF
jgi:outer membrane receptor protein involved in Fe transport